MIFHYIRAAMRNIARFKLLSGINIFGLATGMMAVLLIFLFVQDEYSFDKSWQNAEQIGRLETTFTPPGREPMTFVYAPGPARQALKDYFPEEVELSARLHMREPTIQLGGEYFLEEIAYVDPEFQDIFQLPAVRGDIAATLASPTGIILSEAMAEKYFAGEDAIGKVLSLTTMGQTKDYLVGAIMENLPQNTHLDMQAMVPVVASDFAENPWVFDHWFSVNSYLYFKLSDGNSIEQLRPRMVEFLDAVVTGSDNAPSEFMRFPVTSLPDIYLFGKGLGEMKDGGDINLVIAFSAVAILILIVASINFVNLSTARASQRAKEVALRKVMGAKRRQLVAQFMGESIVLTALSLMIALVACYLVLPAYNAFLGKDMVLDLLDPMVLLSAFAILLFVGGAGGIYPAMVISSFRPASVLKANKSTETHGSVILRNVLVVFQFAVSICLMIATAVVYMQLDYFRSLDRGYNDTQLLVIEGVSRAGAEEVRETLKQEIKALSMVDQVALVSSPPGHQNENNTSLQVPGEDRSQLVGVVDVDHDFLKTYGIRLLAGRDFDINRANDHAPDVSQEGITQFDENMLVNETFLRKLGLGTPEEAVGTVLEQRFTPRSREDEVVINMTIAGVVPDVYLKSPRQTIRPEIYRVTDNMNALVVRYRGDAATIAGAVEQVWKSMIPTVPYEYYVAEERLAEDFDAEASQVAIFGVFSVLAVLIGCLGLFGLAGFVVERRTKEVGIRKVMGASIPQIVRLMLWQFSTPVLIANLIAWPVTILMMRDWLQTFPYRIDELIMLPLAVGAGVIALAIAWGTVSGYAIKVARANPITALRYE